MHFKKKTRGVQQHKVSRSLSLSTSSRRAMCSVGLLQDHYGNLTNYPVTGASIQYVQRGGRVHVYRMPQIKYALTTEEFERSKIENPKFRDKLASGHLEWRNIIYTEMRKLRRKLLRLTNTDENAKGDHNLIRFKTKQELVDFFNLDVWESAVQKIYDGFGESGALDCVRRKEEFYMWTLLPTSKGRAFMIPKQFYCGPWLVTIYPPTKSLAGKTVIRYNKGVWAMWKHEFGYSTKFAAEWWEHILNEFSNMATKALSVDACVDFITRKNNNQVDFDNTQYYAIDMIINIALELKLWALTRQNIKPEDWKEEWEWQARIDGIADQVMNDAWDAVVYTWGLTQIKYSPADLPHNTERYILPVTLDSGDGLNFGDITGFQIGDYDMGFDTECPYLTLCKLDRSLEVTPILQWAEIICQNDCDTEVMVSYSRVTGKYHSTQLGVDAFGSYNSVYPSESYTERPEKKFQNLNEMQWSVVIDTVDAVDPILQTDNSNLHQLFNQGCSYGPLYYLVQYMDYLDKTIQDAFDFYNLPDFGEEEEPVQESKEKLLSDAAREAHEQHVMKATEDLQLYEAALEEEEKANKLHLEELTGIPPTLETTEEVSEDVQNESDKENAKRLIKEKERREKEEKKAEKVALKLAQKQEVETTSEGSEE